MRTGQGPRLGAISKLGSFATKRTRAGGRSHPRTGQARGPTPRGELCSTEERVRIHSEESGEGKPQLRIEESSRLMCGAAPCRAR